MARWDEREILLSPKRTKGGVWGSENIINLLLGHIGLDNVFSGRLEVSCPLGFEF